MPRTHEYNFIQILFWGVVCVIGGGGGYNIHISHVPNIIIKLITSARIQKHWAKYLLTE